jgi:hypothetical protein
MLYPGSNRNATIFQKKLPSASASRGFFKGGSFVQRARANEDPADRGVTTRLEASVEPERNEFA